MENGVRNKGGTESREERSIFLPKESDGSRLVDIQIISGRGHPKRGGQR